jgi:hypothetical protein
MTPFSVVSWWLNYTTFTTSRLSYFGTVLAGLQNDYSFLALASLSASYLAISSSSVIELGKIKPKLNNDTTTRTQWPILLLLVESVVAGLVSLVLLVSHRLITSYFSLRIVYHIHQTRPTTITTIMIAPNHLSSILSHLPE